MTLGHPQELNSDQEVLEKLNQIIYILLLPTVAPPDRGTQGDRLGRLTHLMHLVVVYTW